MTSASPKLEAGFGATLHQPTAPRAERRDPLSPEDAPRSPVTAAIERQLVGLMEHEAELDAAMARASTGRPMDNRELLQLQATVYAYGQHVEVATRMVDRTAGAVRHLLNVQL